MGAPVKRESNANEVVAESGGFVLFRHEFEDLRAMIRARAGIHLPDHKAGLVASRLARRLRALDLQSFASYAERLQSFGIESETELEQFINALTTNKTSFYRESQHFDVLRDDVLVPIYQQRGVDSRVRIWCSAASTGEEPYTLALTVLEAAGIAAPGRMPRNTLILATDLDTSVLATARRGVYSEEAVEQVPPALATRYLVRGSGEQQGHVRPRREVRSLLSFQQLNLIAPSWPMRGPFDAIFCRNVLIYFDGPTQDEVVRRQASLLAPEGRLFLGHSESMVGTRAGLRGEGHCVFRHRDADEAPR
jgi:chemotaxis protein methyltransferase CheR